MFARAKRLVWHVLGMRRRLGLPAAITLAWQFARPRASSAPIAVHLTGLKRPIWLRPDSSDIDTFLQVFAEGQYDLGRFPQQQHVFDAYRAAVARGETPLIVDCGANIGLSAIWFAHAFPEAEIVAIEPAADNVDLMRRNLSAYPQTTIVAGGVWDQPAALSILDRNVMPWAYQVTESMPGTNGVPSFTIPDIAAGRPILIVKIDVEGSEDALFRSNTDWLRNTNLVIIELHDEKLPGQKTSRNFFQRIVREDFEFGMNGENAFFFLSPAPADARALPHQRGMTAPTPQAVHPVPA
jgi:FkbM family methyltransferase